MQGRPNLPAFFVLVTFIIAALSGCAVRKSRLEVSGYESPAMVLPEADDREHQGPYTIDGVPHYCLPGEEGFVEEGIASWYGAKFHGRKTANGEVYDMYQKTAAHKTLPFGTHVKVVNLSNGKEIIVRINDRGPFVKERIIDLSFAAARELGLIGPGTTRVRLVALSREVGTIKVGDTYKPLVEVRNFRKGKFTVQVGAFTTEDNATRLAERLRVLFDHVTITTYVPQNGTIFYRVRVSLTEDLNETNQVVEKLEYLGFDHAFIVAL
ncbi:MAG: septal ring lytic transglycosylase RlpA family protein [Deltaproteobacteria bacterium]|nr:septal ring lytic transglycosylase RlpA family protein [Deltaproteobacteria bacterium]